MRNATRMALLAIVPQLFLSGCGPAGVLSDPDQERPPAAFLVVERDWGWPGLELEIAGDYGGRTSAIRFAFSGAAEPVEPSFRLGYKAGVPIPAGAERGPNTIVVLVDGVEVGKVTVEILDVPIVECSQPPGRGCCDAETPACNRCHAIAREEAAWWKARCGGVEW